MIAVKDILNRAHGALIFGRRVRILAAKLAQEIPTEAEVLDVGTGDGSIAKAIALLRPDIKIEGIDVLIRPYTHIPVRQFDGEHIPRFENTVDVVSLVDVLHHTSNARILCLRAIREQRFRPNRDSA
jgi:2-polyprenyl-3-methyl-5-hydroxy-6-metoxy-1,4-benzoquinol methylase